MNWSTKEGSTRAASDSGYQITWESFEDGWYTAFDPKGRELASGYGAEGLAKCKRYAERDFQKLTFQQQ